MALKIAVARETAAGERRVALDPDAVSRVRALGAEVLIETGAGQAGWFSDQAYASAGARVLDRATALAEADVLLCVTRPAPDVLEALRPGQTVIGLLAPLTNPTLIRTLADKGVTAISLDGLPRTLSRAQGMDALSSQANVAGYRAVLLAASNFGRFFPLLITAAGTSKPASVLVLGAGVAGLQAIGTARRLGAVVSGYDVRPAAREEVRSLGAKFVELTTSIAASGEGGYARELTSAERDAQQAELSAHIARQDIVITTAQVPGRTPPLLVTAEAVAAMGAGSVIVDMAASELGGNVAGSVAGETIVTPNGVTVIGAPNLPSDMATSASQTYARNISALLKHLIGEGGALEVDLTDEITQGVVVTHAGQVVQAATAAALGGSA
ncbi:MAG: H+-translocating transhydrogenase subunit alpha [Pseudonocardiales bacterium]|jgi:NAD(P) transhydrogenase subunit alpha|nr:H+-translocating transhydrogenase subunit alpha [Pseudonocardiales bacterium]MDQ1751350.1 H+-translocating transhydrogenase subunit alpha [Pseudonocardiales bacterium]